MALSNEGTEKLFNIGTRVKVVGGSESLYFIGSIVSIDGVFATVQFAQSVGKILLKHLEPVSVSARTTYQAFFLNQRVLVRLDSAFIAGTVIEYSNASNPVVKVKTDGDKGELTVAKSRVTLISYQAPEPTRHYFKDFKDPTPLEVKMAELFKATKHQEVVDKALLGVDLESFDIIKHDEYFVGVPKGLKDTDKVPMLIAHTDLHPNLKHPTDDTLEYYEGKFSCATGLGADDRAGVFAISHLLKFKELKFAFCFPDKEEIGLVGSKKFAASKEFKEVFPKVSAFISIDRRRETDGSKSLATYGMDNKELNDWVSTLTSRKVIRGSSTDCRALSDASGNKVACFNLSCGYTAEHTKNETLYFKELLETVADLQVILADERIFKSYPFTREVISYDSGYGYGSTKTKTKGKTKATTGSLAAYGWDESITIDGQIFEEDDVMNLLDIYSYYTGSQYKPSSKENFIIPELIEGSIVRMSSDMVVGHVYGGKKFTQDMYEGLKGKLWTVSGESAKGGYDLASDFVSAYNIPRRWLEEVYDDDPTIE